MIEDLVQICRAQSGCPGHLYIQTHDYPDVDAIASAWGLQTLLAFYDIHTRIRFVRENNRANIDRLVRMYRIEMEPFSGTYDPEDRIILVDCQAREANVTQNGGTVFACIDHHPVKKEFPYDFQILEIVGACASLITREYISAGLTIPPDVATALMFAIKMDTLSFSRGVKEEDIDAFKVLYHSVNWEFLSFLNTSDIALSDLEAYGDAIRNIRVVSDIGLSYVPFDCPDGLIGGISDFILSINELSLSIVGARRPSGIKLSVRSILPYIHAGKLVSQALEGIGDGGGHASFAGGFIPLSAVQGKSDQEIQDFLSRIFMNAYRRQMLADSAASP